MSIIEDIRLDREDLARVLKKHTGIRKIVEDLYPDRAHFIYELLQNAEDTGATEAKFILTRTSLTFEHNGRPFEPQDIYAITDIGEGTKVKDEDKIGRFGIGFKAVFAYTETPRIWSPTFAFEISELVLPSELPLDSELDGVTRFVFPFNNPKKPASNAYAEIEEGLNELSETTLLFLSRISSIAWESPGGFKGEVVRITHSKHHIEIQKRIVGETTASSHYLRFMRAVKGFKKQRVAVAFELEKLPMIGDKKARKNLADQFRIVPASLGHVAVFFPAQKETSGLRFHLHGPFVPELSRASIKETPANAPLFNNLARLVADSLHVIRDLNLLTGDFLGVLPNLQDRIPQRYNTIRTAIRDEMITKPLTPTFAKSHAPASHLLQAKASLKSLLSMDDILFLVDFGDHRWEWAVGITQKNSDADRFLSGLEIREWDIDSFLKVLERRVTDNDWSNPETEFLDWMATKSDEWHQNLYALIYHELDSQYSLGRLKELRIIKLSNGDYSVGNQCFFPDAEEVHDELLPRVAVEIYTSGNNKTEQETAKKLLEKIGVREVGEPEQVEALLQQRYVIDDEFDPRISDIKRFMALVENRPECSILFKDYWIFKNEDGNWCRPGHMYLDVPYSDSGLGAYYLAIKKIERRFALSGDYKEQKISIRRLVAFSRKLGVVDDLYIHEVSCNENPDVKNLVWKAPGNITSYKIDRDFTIPGLGGILKNQCECLSRLVWKACANPKNQDWTKAIYRNNSSYPLREAPSQLAVLLTKSKWIPQKEGGFVRPRDADRDLLPDGFAFDSGWSWLEAIHFGEEISKVSADSRRRREIAKQLGFDDDESLKDAKWFAELDSGERSRLKQEYKNRRQIELPERTPDNSERRVTRVQEQASEAPERLTEQRTRSVSIAREAVKKETDPYLRAQYTNSDGEMICQVCKTALPFKLSDGSHYFEAVEFLPGLKKRHYQNYLSLCPNHAAMYKYANGTTEKMRDFFLAIEANEMDVMLAEEDATIYFTRTHIIDLNALIKMDDSDSEDD
ncbi:hypothetical protein CCR95_09110 [Thiocystis minor]|uniref:sacsin N-terminal ATP-binding-like domain-containing protein n=1 Tax=Thiocystis minor TaxID=61597 RepID=UPI001911731B|nr:hypothetical protein [Thiocystis minor]MBK5964240.1 hypothetical protein [Thiocystis minor]